MNTSHRLSIHDKDRAEERDVSSNGIRLVTRIEAAHFRDHGWVKLDRLISPELASQLLERSVALVDTGANDHALGWWLDFYDPVQKDDRFEWLAFSPEMGLNAQRLMRRSVGVLLYSNLLAVKLGADQPSPASEESQWHQDGTDTPIDRSSWVRIWIALDHITPEMGSIKFIDRAHQLGPLGNDHLFEAEPNDVLFKRFPELCDLGTAGPFEFQPGDATVHSMFAVHGAPVNSTTDPRFAFILTYFADDTRYNANSDALPLIEKAEKAGLTRGDQFGGPAYPHICGPMGLWDQEPS